MPAFLIEVNDVSWIPCLKSWRLVKNFTSAYKLMLQHAFIHSLPGTFT